MSLLLRGYLPSRVLPYMTNTLSCLYNSSLTHTSSYLVGSYSTDTTTTTSEKLPKRPNLLAGLAPQKKKLPKKTNVLPRLTTSGDVYTDKNHPPPKNSPFPSKDPIRLEEAPVLDKTFYKYVENRVPAPVPNADHLKLSREFMMSDEQQSGSWDTTTTNENEFGEEMQPKSEKSVTEFIKRLPGSYRKGNLISRLISNLPLADAILQLQFSKKRVAREVLEHLRESSVLAAVNHGMNLANCFIEYAFVGRATSPKRIFIHGRGKTGIKRLHCHNFTYVITEGIPREKKFQGPFEKKIYKSARVYFERPKRIYNGI